MFDLHRALAEEARQLSKDNFYAGDDDGTIETLIIPDTEHGSL